MGVREEAGRGLVRKGGSCGSWAMEAPPGQGAVWVVGPGPCARPHLALYPPASQIKWAGGSAVCQSGSGGTSRAPLMAPASRRARRCMHMGTRVRAISCE